MAQASPLARHAQRHLHQPDQRGMTLLEVLVVLVIIGIVAATVSPPMARVIESVRFKTTADGVAEQIRALRIAALLEQKDLTLRAQAGQGTDDATNGSARLSGPVGTPGPGLTLALGGPDERALALPPGWSLTGDDLVFLKNGVCLGGDVVLLAPRGRAKTLQFKAPDCAMDDRPQR
ncbi:MAG: prepilin-type N-terminal cleavage/methylation domain-containing protein [Pseudomonadota bacterium]